MITADPLLSDVASYHTVQLFPSFGRLSDDGRVWKLDLNGVILEPGEFSLGKRLLLRLLKRVMNTDPVHFDSELFRQRVQAFVAMGDPGRQIAVRIGSRCHLLQERSKRNGHFSGTVRLAADEVRSLEDEGAIRDGWLRYDVVTRGGDNRDLTGRCLLVPPRGTSVISDIDDTIKHTDVASRRSLLANTFLHKFRSVEGMSSLYRGWAEQGAAFHYVSSSPWQLFHPLVEFCESDGFPAGTMHLRSFRLRDHMLQRVLLKRRKGKGAIIRALLGTFPNRRFLLVGDAGEGDPELYARIARRFPSQVARILIRQLPDQSLEGERLAKLLRQIPAERWQFFRDPADVDAAKMPVRRELQIPRMEER